jgi:hypothetical protein
MPSASLGLYSSTAIVFPLVRLGRRGPSTHLNGMRVVTTRRRRRCPPEQLLRVLFAVVHSNSYARHSPADTRVLPSAPTFAAAFKISDEFSTAAIMLRTSAEGE